MEANDVTAPRQIGKGSCVMAMYPRSWLVTVRARGGRGRHPERQVNVLCVYSVYHDLFKFEAGQLRNECRRQLGRL